MPLSELGSTPWVDSSLSPLVPAIERRLGPGYVPRFTGSGKRLTFEEFGCGHYGCAMPTRDKAVVLKATTDPAEAWLAAWLAHEQHQCGPDGRDEGCAPVAGIVRYLAVYATPKRKGRSKIYLIWREEAQDVGGIKAWNAIDQYMNRNVPTGYTDWQARAMTESQAYLSAYNITAAVIRNRIVTKVKPEVYVKLLDEARGGIYEDYAFEWAAEHLGGNVASVRRTGSEFEELRGDRARQLAIGLAVCKQAAELMENTDGMTRVGQTLAWLYDEGILLADIHGGNLGRVLGGDWNDVLITDPGHAFPIRADFERRIIDELEE